MRALANLYFPPVNLAERLAPATLPTLARFTFAATLLGYFWASALTKTGDGVLGVFQPSLGAYAQIFPKAMEAASYDVGQLSMFHWAVVVAGTLAEFILPLLITIGLLTRLAALGMIGFVIVQSLTDLYGHGGIEQPETLGAWFDRIPDSVILDQRLFWMVVLVTLVLKGPGPLSIDRLLKIR
ncbi:DoxX family protein [Aliiroseovarius sp. F47248L]|uniref:DoxX family protein n=1 Tax=Aliiroseovarius sp. F47248L TaxID=2926420 RepID=UPI001FF1D9D9|nr:DoxX family protein [Aliiroseovarius sp. F47248L]MCK0139168.1 DoxX family protein [Aliiroseovarius sp. F47248L]